MKSIQTPKAPIIAAWIVVLLTASLPKIILQEIFKQTVSFDQQVLMSLGVLFIALLATLIWQPLRGLRPFLILLAVTVGSQWLVYDRIGKLPFYRAWLHNPSFNVYMLAEECLNMLVALVVIAALLLMRKKFSDFYLAKGDTAAPAEPVRLMMTFFISLGTLAFLVIAGRPPLDIVIQALPFLPAILLAAALNAFYEEVTYKAALLSVLESPVGARQALYMVAVYFGIWHFYGIPYGVVGVLLAAFLGWILAKSMQETHGLFWAWFIHFWQDVWIFSFLAIGSIIPGG
jgi:hypothetical protein